MRILARHIINFFISLLAVFEEKIFNVFEHFFYTSQT
jgi:hypothetical protein